VPSRTASSAGHREEGTASIELIAAIPLLLLTLFVAAQVVAVGQALWSAGIAARAGARAAAVGGDAGPAARRALPPSLRPGATVRDADGVTVRVRVPRLLQLSPRLDIEARSSLGDGG